ncbi:MAG: nitroreductase family protein [Candidatus Bathyarchaeia archaeon]
MDLFEAIQGRRSIRAFTAKDVPDDMVLKLIDAARMAPSAGNVQPWEFIVVRDNRYKDSLATAALGQSFISEAPVVVVVCADLERASWAYGQRGKTLYCIQDTAAATQNLLLAAYGLGLGACWVGAFDENLTKKILTIPDRYRPVAIIPIGYPARSPHPTDRRSLKEIVHYERFQPRQV